MMAVLRHEDGPKGWNEGRSRAAVFVVWTAPCTAVQCSIICNHIYERAVPGHEKHRKLDLMIGTESSETTRCRLTASFAKQHGFVAAND
jgi:hypothetical protein